MKNIGLVIIIIVTIGLCYILYKAKQTKETDKQNALVENITEQSQELEVPDENVVLNFTDANGSFDVQGNLDEFIITINNRYSFKSKNGVIVAFKDKNKSKDFKEYKELNDI